MARDGAPDAWKFIAWCEARYVSETWAQRCARGRALATGGLAGPSSLGFFEPRARAQNKIDPGGEDTTEGVVRRLPGPLVAQIYRPGPMEPHRGMVTRGIESQK